MENTDKENNTTRNKTQKEEKDNIGERRKRS